MKGDILPSISPANRPPHVLILHAYSPSNSGDGLLVDLAIDLVRRVSPEFTYQVVASDADGFDDPRFMQWRSPLKFPRALRRISMALTGVLGPTNEVRKVARDADLIVAVGGAYLRGGSTVESLKSWGAHHGQVKLAARHGDKSVYFPQSIGPYGRLYGARTRKLLGRVRRVYVRDDRTASDLAELSNVERVPDMAILEWARNVDATPIGALGRPVFIARNLGDPRRYYDLLAEVRDSDQFDWAVQATGSANNDAPLTAEYAKAEAPPLASVLGEKTPRIVVSTRLHGSLSSLIAGYPTIHLSYERKGYSAFADLGIPEYAISARDATLPQIAELMERIERDPQKYWESIRAQREQITAAEQRIERDVRAVISGER
ncbi:polysaccharide pyruvyl transferase family protein [Microbacterium sp. A84]|uniref:polysaccharide pyruvyl transferase family protein n=1 Tax=Microbacterium sp. A84 TaxID=3450715 RepID=UPI003F42173E